MCYIFRNKIQFIASMPKCPWSYYSLFIALPHIVSYQSSRWVWVEAKQLIHGDLGGMNAIIQQGTNVWVGPPSSLGVWDGIDKEVGILLP